MADKAKTLSNPSFLVEPSKILGKSSTQLREVLLKIGIENNSEGQRLLKAKTTSEEYLAGVLRDAFKDIPELKILAAASALKGKNPFEDEEDKSVDKAAQVMTEAATLVVKSNESNRKPAQMKDKELLEIYVDERDYEIEQELHKRAKFRRFVVLEPGKYEPGEEIIDIEKSLDLLKKARRMEIPQMASFDGKVLQVHRITELNPEDRKTELCPICSKGLFQGYCQDCGLDFGGIGMDERAYIRLVTDKEAFDPKSFSDRRAVHASALKGLDSLRQTWPSVSPEFEDLKLTNSLPQVVVMKPVLSEKKMDPFHTNGNRSY